MDKETKIYFIILFFMLLGALLVVILTPLSSLVMPLLLACILAYFLRAPIRLLEERMSRVWAVSIVFFGMLSLIVALLVLAVPAFVRQVAGLAKELPEYAALALKIVQAVVAKLGIHLNAEQNERISVYFMSLSGDISKYAMQALKGLIGAIPHLSLYLLSPVFAYFLLLNGDKPKEALLYLLPFQWRSSVRETMREMDRALWKYLSGQITMALFVAILTMLGLWMAGVRYAPVLGLIAGFLEVIPYFGPLISTIPVASVAVAQGWQELTWGLVVILIVQQMEGLVLSPLILGGSVKINPGLIILIVIVGELLYGIPGMFFAVPVVITLRVIIQNIYKALMRARRNYV